MLQGVAAICRSMCAQLLIYGFRRYSKVRAFRRFVRHLEANTLPPLPSTVPYCVQL